MTVFILLVLLGVTAGPASAGTKTYITAYECCEVSEFAGKEAYQQVIRLLALTGRRSEALAEYVKCRLALKEELDAEPSLETNILYELIRDQR